MLTVEWSNWLLSLVPNCRSSHAAAMLCLASLTTKFEISSTTLELWSTALRWSRFTARSFLGVVIIDKSIGHILMFLYRIEN
jgi:hypothetical protein